MLLLHTPGIKLYHNVLPHAYYYLDMTIIEQLLQMGCDMNATFDGETCLHLMVRRMYCREKALPIIRLLLDYGANPIIPNRNNKSMVNYMARSEYCKSLLRLGLDPNLQDTNGDTALMIAVRKRQVRAVTQLLGAGASVIPQNKLGETACSIWTLPQISDKLKLMLDHENRMKTRKFIFQTIQQIQANQATASPIFQGLAKTSTSVHILLLLTE